MLFPNWLRILNYNNGITACPVFLHGVCRFHPIHDPAAKFTYTKGTVSAFPYSVAVIAVCRFVHRCNLPDFLFGEKLAAVKGVIQNRPMLFRDLPTVGVKIEAIGRTVIDNRYEAIAYTDKSSVIVDLAAHADTSCFTCRR